MTRFIRNVRLILTVLPVLIVFLAIDANAATKKKLPSFEKGLTGIQAKGTNFYLLNDNSEVMTGWQNYAGNLYYFSKKTGKMFFGVKKISKTYYYFDENGCCVPDVAFNDNYSLRHGFYTDEDNKTRYYYNGIMIKGFANISGVDYYFNEESGIMQDYQDALNKYRSDLQSLNKQTESAGGSYVTVNNAILHEGYNTDPMVDERSLLAAIIMAEAGNQKKTPLYTMDNRQVFKGQLAVGYVIANRLTDNLGIREIIYRKNQFTPARNGRLSYYLNNLSLIPEYVYAAADVVLATIYDNTEPVPEYPSTAFKWNNFWGLKYAGNYTNFFEVFADEGSYEIIQDHVFFNYSRSLKANSRGGD